MSKRIMKKLEHCEIVIVEEFETHTYSRNPETGEFNEFKSKYEFAKFLEQCKLNGDTVTFIPDVELDDDDEGLSFEELHPARPVEL